MQWKQAMKRVAYWTVPPGFRSLGRRAWEGRWLGYGPSLAMQELFARNIKFRNIYEGQRCFILATGPSINKQDLRPLKNEICFAVSMFFLHKGVREIDPLYHVHAPNHAPHGFEVPQKAFDGFNEFYSDRTTIFLGHTPYKYSLFNFLEQNPQFKKDNIHYLNYYHSPALDESNYNNPDIWDITRALFSPRSVVYCAIQIAAYMGFRYIYLMGCDYNYLLHVARGSSMHFYEDGKGPDESKYWRSTEEFYLAYHRAWKQYRLMREYLEPKGCYIYNATAGGLLDVFPRVTLPEALAGKHQRGTRTE